MKTKSFLVFSASVFATSALLIVFHTQRPDSIDSIVSQTHRHIKNFQEELRGAEETSLVAEERYLARLGLGDEEPWHNTSMPCVVSYALGDQHAQAVGLVRNVLQRLPRHTLLLYDLGLTPSSRTIVSSYCNSSRCVLLELALDGFPAHVADEATHAFRPLIIQHALSRVGGVVFVESSLRFACTEEELRQLYAATARGSGVLAWPRRSAVSSLTHPRMFHYFHTDADDFLFLPMVGAERLLLHSTPELFERIMRPWIRCALTHDCIMPIGSQSGGCRFDKKPQYRYSGCHSHDASALNIVLGLRYELDETRYSYDGSARLFHHVSPEQAAHELSALESNATAELPPRTAHPATAPLDHPHMD